MGTIPQAPGSANPPQTVDATIACIIQELPFLAPLLTLLLNLLRDFLAGRAQPAALPQAAHLPAPALSAPSPAVPPKMRARAAIPSRHAARLRRAPARATAPAPACAAAAPCALAPHGSPHHETSPPTPDQQRSIFFDNLPFTQFCVHFVTIS